ncbi:MAG: hypothetical protein GY861_24170, partial [bacterium]|nr:hypothetical protein [bacterium]
MSLISGVIGFGGAGFQVFIQSDNSPGYYADAAARDVYFGANPSELTRLDQNQFLIIRLADDGAGSVAYQQRASSAWVDVTSLVQGNTGPAGATGNSFFFESLAARDTFFGTSPNEGLLENGLPISVNVGDVTASVFIWGGASTPVAYDSTLWRLAAAEVSAGTLYLGIGGAGLSSGAELLNFTQADGGLTYLHGIPYDDTGNEEPAFWKLPALSQAPVADVFSSTLSDPQAVSGTNSFDAYVKTYTLIPATSGELRVQVWIGTDETGPQIVDTYITVDPGDIGNQTAFQTPNPTFIKTGMDTYTKFSGIQLDGGLQTSGPFIGQTVPFMTLGLFLAEKVPFVYNEMSGFSLKVPNASGVAAIEFLNDSDATGLSISYSDGSDDTEIIGEIGNLIIGTDESDSYINISPDGGTGFKKVPTAGYVFDIYAAGSDIVGLHSGKAVTLEVGAYGDSDSTNLIFNKGDVGVNQSEFVLFNNNHATEATRYFRMGYADEIATQGGLNISDANNFVSIGTRTDPDSPLHVYQDDTETGDQCGITIEQDGTGDSVLQWLLSGGQRWVAGIANSGGDAFEISSSINLGSNTRFIINTTGEVKITDSLMVGSSSNPTSPLHVYQNDTETGAAAGITIEQDSTGDAVLHYVLTGIQTISAGVDYSGSGHYKISGSADLSTGNILTATIAGNVGIGDDNPASKLHLYEDNTLTGSTVGLTIEQDGTGDSLAQWYLSGGARYLAGIDNSDSDLFKIEYGAFLSDGAGIQIDSNNHVGIKTAPASILHIYQDDAVTGTSGGITIEQDGGGDAMLQFLLTGGTRWVMGIDNDDSDRFKINLGNSMATEDNFILDETNGIDLHISNSSTLNWALRAGIDMHNHNTGDGTYTSLAHRGASNIASGILFKNDDYSENYSHIVLGATDVNGFEENALTIKPAHIEIANSTNTPYSGSGIIENLLTYSEQIDDTVWQKLGSNAPVVVANDAVAPNGETTADKVTVSGGAGYLRHNVTLVEDDVYMLSFWAKNVSGDKTIQIALELADYTSIETTSMWKRYSIPLIANSENFVAFRTVGSAYHLWGVQLHAGTDETPYTKTEETALTTATYGASVNGDLIVSGDVVRPGGQTFATKPTQVVEVWSLDDMPRVSGTGDVIPEYKLYRFMTEIDWGTTRLKLENDAYALFEGADVFVTSQTYSGTDPWIYGEGTIRCVGNGMTWKITADNATMFDITSGGWFMDYSTLMTTGDNCSLGTIVAPSVTDPLLGARFISTRSLFQGFKTGLTLVNPGNIHIDVSFFHDSTDAIG